jgi:hypothetical protein
MKVLNWRGRYLFPWLRKFKERQAGEISIFIFWAIALTVIVAVSLSYRVNLELRSYVFYKDKICGRILIWNGFLKALEVLRKDYRENPNLDTLYDEWGEEIIYEDGNGVCRVKIKAEDGKLNINHFIETYGKDASFKMLKEIFSLIGSHEDLAPAVLDWIDQDQNPTFGGKEEYFDYKCRNGPIATLYELAYVEGGGNLDEGTFPRLQGILSLYGDGKLNLNVIAEECFLVLADALGFKDLATKIWVVRENGDYFEKLDSGYLDRKIREWSSYGLTEDEKEKWDKEYRKFFKLSSAYFRIYLEGMTKKGIKLYTLAVVERKGSKFEILEWKENFWVE